MDRTSAQPQVNLSLLRSISFQIKSLDMVSRTLVMFTVAKCWKSGRNPINEPAKNVATGNLIYFLRRYYFLLMVSTRLAGSMEELEDQYKVVFAGFLSTGK
jgi:hypothetical protein